MSRQLDDWIEGYLQYVDNTEPPEIFKLWSGLAAVSGALQRKCSVVWQDEIFPNTYVVLVGPAGAARKGTAMGPALSLMAKTGIQLSSDAPTIEAVVRKLKKNTSTEVSPTGRMTSHSSMTIFSPELAVFIGHNNPKMITYLTDWYDCKTPWVYETVGRGEEEIHGICISLFGATTPDLLQSILPQDAVGGGLTSRMIFVYGDKKSKIVSGPSAASRDGKLQKQLLADLESMLMLNGEFSYTEEFVDCRVRWYEHQEKNPPFHDPNFAAYCARRATHHMKLCMIVNASRTDDMLLEARDFNRALFILEETEKHMLRVFSGYGRADYAALLPRIMGLISMRGRIKLEELMMSFYRDLSKEEMLKVLSTLDAIKFCKVKLEGSSYVIEIIQDAS